MDTHNNDRTSTLNISAKKIPLSIKRGPGPMYSEVGTINDTEIHTIVSISGDYGLLEAYEDNINGWVDLNLVEIIR